MTNNDILRRLRYAFDLSNKRAVELFRLDPVATINISENDFMARIAKEGEPNFVTCSDAELAAFMDGLIVAKRGLREPDKSSVSSQNSKANTIIADDFRLSKNDLLKKLRIAMNFRESDMLSTLEIGGSTLSKAELGALFRKPQHRHYRACGNQVLRNFIKGLTIKLRES